MVTSSTANGIWQRIFGKPSPTQVRGVAQRFIGIFGDHGVIPAQIPRLLPGMQFQDFQTEEKLLSALTPEILDQTASLFAIRTKWLEGTDDAIYEYQSCYKRPELLFELLSQIRSRTNENSSWFPLRVLHCTKRLDRNAPGQQLLVPVLVEKIAEIGDVHIERYYPFNDGFDWSHQPARIQLKAMSRLIFKILGMPVPLMRIDPTALQEILERKRVPRNFLQSCLLTTPSLEDFAITKEESGAAREVDEMPDVLRYIDKRALTHLITTESPLRPSADQPPSALGKFQEEPAKAAPLPKTGKRANIEQVVWHPIQAAATILWAENKSLTIAEVIKRLKKMDHLKAKALSDSASRKRIAQLAPENIRGKPGRKPKKLT